MNKKVKVFSFVLSFVMIVLLSVGTTLALLTDTTDSVKNTFTATTDLLENEETFVIQEHTVDANFKNTETIAVDTDSDGVYVEYNGLFPGITIDKDPTILVGTLEASAYLYVVIDQTNMSAADDADLFSWAIADTWMQLGTSGSETLYVLKDGTAAKALVAGTNPTSAGGFGILANDQISVKNYTNTVDSALTDASMTFSAYLVQAFGVDASDAAKALAAYNSAFTADFAA